jgi:hypothetical protein
MCFLISRRASDINIDGLPSKIDHGCPAMTVEGSSKEKLPNWLLLISLSLLNCPRMLSFRLPSRKCWCNDGFSLGLFYLSSFRHSLSLMPHNFCSSSFFILMRLLIESSTFSFSIMIIFVIVCDRFLVQGFYRTCGRSPTNLTAYFFMCLHA